MHYIERQNADQPKWKDRPFEGSPMEWLAGAIDNDRSKNFPYLALYFDEIKKVKQAAVTLAAMRFILRGGEKYFAGAERIASLTNVSMSTVSNHWRTLCEHELITRVDSNKQSNEFRLKPKPETGWIMMPIGTVAPEDKFREQVLLGIVLSQTAKLLSCEMSLGDAVVNHKLGRYLEVQRRKWESLTGLAASQLFAAKSALIAAEKITAHGDPRSLMLPTGKHEDVELLRADLAEKDEARERAREKKKELQSEIPPIRILQCAIPVLEYPLSGFCNALS
jgi:DNA-binding transcriptional ArsR family regulator